MAEPKGEVVVVVKGEAVVVVLKGEAEVVVANRGEEEDDAVEAEVVAVLSADRSPEDSTVWSSGRLSCEVGTLDEVDSFDGGVSREATTA